MDCKDLDTEHYTLVFPPATAIGSDEKQVNEDDAVMTNVVAERLEVVPNRQQDFVCIESDDDHLRALENGFPLIKPRVSADEQQSG